MQTAHVEDAVAERTVVPEAVTEQTVVQHAPVQGAVAEGSAAVQNDVTNPPVGMTPAESKSIAAEPFLDLAQPVPSEEATLATNDSETNELFVRLAVWTVIILCLCVLTVLALRRWQRRQGILPEGAGRSRVLETLAIGPGRAVSLVQLGDLRAVVGTDGSGIKTIVLAPPAFEDELSRFEEPSVEGAADAEAA